MKLVAATAVIWIAIALFWWLTVGEDVAKAGKKAAPVDWARIASFYSGSPQKLSEDKRGPLGGTTGLPMSGEIRLGSGLLQGLKDFERYIGAAKRGDKSAASRADVLGTNALSVLLHESMHNRDFSGAKEMGGQGWYLPAESQGPMGFYGSGNEVQAAALGAELIPDMLNRFFGIPLDSPLSKRIAKTAKHRGEYQSAYRRGIQNG